MMEFAHCSCFIRISLPSAEISCDRLGSRMVAWIRAKFFGTRSTRTRVHIRVSFANPKSHVSSATIFGIRDWMHRYVSLVRVRASMGSRDLEDMHQTFVDNSGNSWAFNRLCRIECALDIHRSPVCTCACAYNYTHVW
jgi:hypothetical protein